MYRVVWVYRKNDSDAPFFYEAPESADFRAAIDEVSNQNPDLVVRDLQISDAVMLDECTFKQVSDYKIWLSKFLEKLPNGLIVRNKYLIDNEQELVVISEEEDNTRVIKIVPV